MRRAGSRARRRARRALTATHAREAAQELFASLVADTSGAPRAVRNSYEARRLLARPKGGIRHLVSNSFRYVTSSLVLGAALVVAGSAPAIPANAGAGGYREAIQAYLDENALTWDEVATGWTILDFDTATGETVARPATLDEAIAFMGELESAVPEETESHGVSHLVTGMTRHSCSDGVRMCYCPGAPGSSTPFRCDKFADARDARTLAAAAWASEASFLPPEYRYFPIAGSTSEGGQVFPGGQAFRIWGKYFTGVHRAGPDLVNSNPAARHSWPASDNPVGEVMRCVNVGCPSGPTLTASGATHGDVAMHGVGVGRISMIYFVWGGGDKYISFGKIEAQGSFEFCLHESSEECAVPFSVGRLPLP